MMGDGYFSGGPVGPRVQLSAEEAQALRAIVASLDDVLHDTDRQAPEAGSVDPLEHLVGMTGPLEAPDDPALARLFPDAYRGDALAAAEFRRFTEPSLRSRKQAAVVSVLADIDAAESGGSVIELDDERAQAWLGALTDVRLLLAARLGIETDADSDRLASEMAQRAEDDPAVAVWTCYSWLGELQGSLIEALSSSL